ncbi:response regulator receiver protein [Flammeovirgaceae bacterium 311]|nr:response regulator receiver protein [Flammeovirgaceae bacterium 311]
MIKNLLLIDDDVIYSFVFPELVKQSGKVEHFHIENDGQKGLEYLQRCEVFPDLIVLDLKMPVMDGFGFLEEYGQHFADKLKNTVLVVMTSSIRQKDREEVMRHSFVNDYLSKPITESLLNQITEKYFVA